MDLRDKILSANDRKLEPLEVPEWGVTVYVQSMTAGGRGRILAIANDDEGATQALAVYLCCCDETGTRIFQEADIPAIMEKNAKAVQRIVNKIYEVNKVGEDVGALAEKN